MSVASRVARALSLVAGGGSRAAQSSSSPALPGEGDDGARRRPAPLQLQGRRLAPTLSELFAIHPRDGGWAGFLLAQIERAKPLLWVQERMAILESGRIHPPGLPSQNLIHVEARDAKSALWAMEEGLRCAALGAVIGELWGDPASLDFTATRRLAVAAERVGVPCWLVRIGGSANLSGARMRWRVASRPSLAHPFDPRAPGSPAWDAELFRARGCAPGRWSIAHDPRQAGAEDPFHLLAAAGDRAMGEDGGERLRA